MNIEELEQQHKEVTRIEFVLNVLWFIDGLTTQTDSIFPTGTKITISHLCDQSLEGLETLVKSELTLAVSDIGWTKAKTTIDDHHRWVEDKQKEIESFQKAREQYWIHQQKELDEARRIKERRKAILMGKESLQRPHRGVW